MFTNERTVAIAPIQCAGVSGIKLFVPVASCPNKYMPPTAVIPDMAFVTAISGECKAGATPQTT